MQPLAIAVIGGLLVSMALTLLLVPSVYLIVDGAATTLTNWVTGTGRAEERRATDVEGAGVSTVRAK